jgi:mRNA interferase MazF
MKAVQVLFDETLLQRLDRDPEVKRDGRSAVLRRATADYLRRVRRKEIGEAYQRAYGDKSGLGEEFAGWEDQGTWAENRPRRPVLVLTRPEVISLLHTVTVAPVTSTMRGAPSEVAVGIAEGLKHDSAVNLDHVQTIERSRLSRYVGQLRADKMRDVCRALAIALGCAD